MLIRLSRIIPVLILGLVAMYFAAKHRSQQPIKLTIYDLPVMPLMNPKKVARVEDIYWRARISMQKKEVRNTYLCAYKIDQISDSSDYKQGRAYSHYLKGLVLYENKNYDSALYHQKRALLIQQDSIAQEDSWQMCYILSDLAKVYEKLGNQEQADICLLRRRDYMRGIWVRDFKELEEKKAKEKREKIHKEQEERDIIETLPRNLRLLYTKSELTKKKNIYQSLFYANEVIIKSLDQGSRDGFLLGNFRVSRLFSDMYLDIYHDVDKSIEWADRMIEQAKNLEYKEGEALGYHEKAYIYNYSLSLHDSALFNYYNSLQLRKETNNIKAVADCYQGMANAYYKLQFPDQSESYYNLAIDHAKKINDKSTEAAAYRGMGLVHQNLKNDYVVAALHYAKCLELQKELTNKEGIADAYHSLAGTYYLREDFKQAEVYYLKALEYRIANENSRLADTYFSLGLVHKELKNYTSAKLYFNKSLEVSERVSYSTLIVRSHMEFGIIAQLQKNYPTAIQELTIAQQLAEQDKNTHLNLLIDITDTFSKLYEEMGDDGKAMDYVHKKEAWQNIAKAEREQITKLLEKQRFDIVKWEDIIEKGKEDKGFSIWWYILSAVVLGFVAGVKGRKIYTGIQNALSMVPHQKKSSKKSIIDQKLDRVLARVVEVMENKSSYSDLMRKEAVMIHAKLKKIEEFQLAKKSIPKRELNELWEMIKHARWFLGLAEEKIEVKNT